MKLPAILVKSGLAVAGAGIYLFFRRLIKGMKKNNNTKETAVKPPQKESQAVG